MTAGFESVKVLIVSAVSMASNRDVCVNILFTGIGADQIFLPPLRQIIMPNVWRRVYMSIVFNGNLSFTRTSHFFLENSLLFISL